MLLGGINMKKQEDIILGNRIKEIRIKPNYDQKRFANEIGATVSALSNWENGRNKPNMDRLSKIAQLGDTTVTELLADSSNEQFLIFFEKRWAFLENSHKYIYGKEPTPLDSEFYMFIGRSEWGKIKNYKKQVETLYLSKLGGVFSEYLALEYFANAVTFVLKLIDNQFDNYLQSSLRDIMGEISLLYPLTEKSDKQKLITFSNKVSELFNCLDGVHHCNIIFNDQKIEFELIEND